MAASSTKETSHIISNMHMGEDAGGVDFKVFGDTTANYVMWDASNNRWLTSGTGSTFYIGAHASTAAGSGVALAEAGPSAAMRVYADDGGVAIGTATGSVPDVRNALFRTLVTVDNSSFDMRLFSVQGHIKSVNGEWGDEQVAAVHGYMELVRTAGTITLQSYGVTAGVMATVETAGDLGVAATHNLAGLAAVSKLGFAGTFTDNTNTSGVYVGLYNGTYWSNSTTCDKWNHGLYIAANSVDKGIQIGEMSSTTAGSGVTLDSTTTAVVEVHADDNDAARTAGISGRVIHGRFMVYADTTQENWGVDGQVKWSGVAHTANVNAGVVGRFESTGTCSTATGSGNTIAAGVMGRIGGGGTFTIGAGTYVVGVLAYQNTQTAVTFTNSGLVGFMTTKTDVATADNWDYGLYVENATTGIYIAAGGGRALQVGALSSDDQLGMTFVATTGVEAVSVYTDDGDVALTGGSPFVGIHSRSMFFQNQIGATTVLGVFGQLKYESGVTIGPARVAAVEGYNELMTTNTVNSGGYLVGVSSQTEATAGTFTVANGGVCAGFHARLTGAGTITQASTGILAGLKVDSSATTGTWGYGVYVVNADTAIRVTGAIKAGTGRGLHVGISQANAAHSDGYGANELQLDLTGTTANNSACLSAWVNMTEGTHAHQILAQSNGVYESAGADISGASIVAGMKMQFQSAESPHAVYMFEMASPGMPITSLYYVGSFHNDIGYEVSNNETSLPTGYLRFISEINHNVLYVRLYADTS